MSTPDTSEDGDAMQAGLDPVAEAEAADAPAVDAAPRSEPSTGLAPRRPLATGITTWRSAAVPATVAQSGNPAAKRFLEFFAVTIRNPNTRMSYYRAACRFFAWCDTHRLPELAEIEPMHVAAYIEIMQTEFEKPTVKQHLAAVRMGCSTGWSPARSSPPTRRTLSAGPGTQ